MTPETLVAVVGGVAYLVVCAGIGWVAAPLVDAVARPRRAGRHRARQGTRGPDGQ